MGVVVKYHTDDTKFLFGGKTLIFRGFLNIFPNSKSPTPPSNILIGVGKKCLWRKQWEVIGLMYMYIVHTPSLSTQSKAGRNRKSLNTWEALHFVTVAKSLNLWIKRWKKKKRKHSYKSTSSQHTMHEHNRKSLNTHVGGSPVHPFIVLHTKALMGKGVELLLLMYYCQHTSFLCSNGVET